MVERSSEEADSSTNTIMRENISENTISEAYAHCLRNPVLERD